MDALATGEGDWVSHMQQVRLHITFDPTRTLSNPVLEVTVGLLKGSGVDDSGLKAGVKQAHAKVAVFCNVKRIPTFHHDQVSCPEMVACTTKRNCGFDRLE